MSKYLYGLSIQGIQSYIFATNKLIEIVGASTLVSELPREVFKEVLGKELPIENLKTSNMLLNAAGNFKYIFEENEKEDCALLFREVPKMFAEHGGDITVSQAVVEFEELEQHHLNELEEKLKSQRNIPKAKGQLGWMSMRRTAKTGNPIFEKDGKEELDINQSRKRNKYKESKGGIYADIFPNIGDKEFTNDIENITSDDYENWIAVIHADGNSLGKLIMRLSEGSTDIKETYQEFSRNLKEATEKAVNAAFEETILGMGHIDGKIPFRPIIIGGDDVTIITRGDLALKFTQKYLGHFEKETAKCFEGKKLTACAGIAYIKSHYPFHYGADLAEELCKAGKKDSRSINSERPPSSILFHRMQSSFVRKWETIKKTELKAGSVSLMNGPYYISEKVDRPQVEELIKYANILAEDSAPKSGIRQWLSELDKDEVRAKDLMSRVISNDKQGGYVKKLNLQYCLSNSQKTHLYDALVMEDLKPKKDK